MGSCYPSKAHTAWWQRALRVSIPPLEDAKVISVTHWQFFLRSLYELGTEILLKFNSCFKPDFLKASENPGIKHQQRRVGAGGTAGAYQSSECRVFFYLITDIFLFQFSDFSPFPQGRETISPLLCSCTFLKSQDRAVVSHSQPGTAGAWYGTVPRTEPSVELMVGQAAGRK